MTFLTKSVPPMNLHSRGRALGAGHRGRWAAVAVTLTLFCSPLLSGSATSAAPDLTPQLHPRDLKYQATMAEVIRVLEEIRRDPSYDLREDKILCLFCLLEHPDEPEVCDKWCK